MLGAVDVEVQNIHNGRNVGQKARQNDAVGNAKVEDAFFERHCSVAISHNEKTDIGGLFGAETCRTEKGIVTFSVGQSCHHAHDKMIIAKPKFMEKGFFLRLGKHREGLAAVVNDVDSFFGNAVCYKDILHVIGGCDGMASQNTFKTTDCKAV